MEQVLSSIIGTYGYEEGLFELAVIKKRTETDYNLCYTTEITNDVEGYLTNEEVIELLEKIKKLESVE